MMYGGKILTRKQMNIAFQITVSNKKDKLKGKNDEIKDGDKYMGEKAVLGITMTFIINNRTY